MKLHLKTLKSLCYFAIGVAIVGCADPTKDLAPTEPVGGKESKEYRPMAAAGVGKDLSKSLADNAIRMRGLIVATDRFGHRSNPFALSKEEIAFDKAQAAERLLIEGGNFNALYELPDPDAGVVTVAPEPQPYRRLSGILIGDSVLAILEENGRSTIVRPGMMIPDTNWRIVSIDRDKAILRRVGSTRQPVEVEVRLETAPPSLGTGGGGFNPGGGQQGGPPGGGPPAGGGRPGGGRGGVGAND